MDKTRLDRLKQIVERHREKQGYCHIDLQPYNSYASVKGIRSSCRDFNTKYSVDVHYIIEKNSRGEFIISFLDGVTGYEQYAVKDLMCISPDREWLCINSGSINRYDDLKVDAQAVRSICWDVFNVQIRGK